MLFFNETAEELVNRLFDEWIEKNTFANNAPLNSPTVRQSTISGLKELDERFRKMNKPEDDPVMIQSAREHYVLLNLAKTFSFLFNRAISNPSPKPTHRQTRQKPNHLRLVVNG